MSKEIRNSIKIAIRNILKEGLTDIFDKPFEVGLLANEEFAEKIIEEISSNIKSNSLAQFKFSEINTYLMPKNHAFSFRKCSLIQPIDTIKYFALVILIAKTIELNRIKAGARKIFSYRYKVNNKTGFVFDTKYTLRAFQQEANKLAQRATTKIVVACDIANYYERLNLHRLENILLSIGCDRSIVKLINELLLFWSGRDSYGLPVGSNASRILAEASLIGVDNYLLSNNVKFIRFVDDYRLFAKDAIEAHYWLSLLIDRLGQEGLSINMNKTKIELKSDIKSSSDLKTKSDNKDTEQNPFIIQAGYGGLIPTKFRNLSEREIIKLKSKQLDELVAMLENQEIIEAASFIEVIKVHVALEEHNALTRLLHLLPKFLQITPYFIDTLIKHGEQISQNHREEIIKYFSNLLNQQRFTPEYLKVAYIKILGNIYFENKAALLEYYREQKKNDGAYSGRVILDALYSLADRNIVMEIRKDFARSNLWEKRQIIRIVKKVMNNEEARPWLKNLSFLEINDLFLSETIEESKRKSKKKRK